VSPNAASQLDFFAGLITEMKGHSVPMGPGAINFSVREPLGVVAKIRPTEPETKMGAIGAVGDRTRKVSGGTDQLYAGEEYLYPAAAAEQRGQAGLLEKDFMNIDAQ
jgi:hypothetical protein